MFVGPFRCSFDEYKCSFDVYLYPLPFVLAMIFIFIALLQSDIGFFFSSKFLSLVVWLVCLIHCVACICLLAQFMMLEI